MQVWPPTISTDGFETLALDNYALDWRRRNLLFLQREKPELSAASILVNTQVPPVDGSDCTIDKGTAFQFFFAGRFPLLTQRIA